jgi:hypothetical protein
LEPKIIIIVIHHTPLSLLPSSSSSSSLSKVLKVLRVGDGDTNIAEQVNLRAGLNVNINFSCGDVKWAPGSSKRERERVGLEMYRHSTFFLPTLLLLLLLLLLRY